jgi:methylmalonyl-CoA mutase, N-terminal domain
MQMLAASPSSGQAEDLRNQQPKHGWHVIDSALSPKQPEHDGGLAAHVRQWRTSSLKPAVDKLRAGIDPEAVRLYTPDDTIGHDYLATVGLPGEYPFTAWLYPVATPFSGGGELNRAGRYSGYGTSEDCRDYYLAAARSGLRIGGPNVASDLPSQLGWDSDAAEAAGEVGRVGVAIDSLRDFETIYEAFGEPSALGRISSNWTINGPAAIYVAFYYALARKHGVDPALLRCTPQNDILKEFVARGLYIFPAKPSMRLVGDIMSFMARQMPRSNSISICAEHMRYAGATTEQSFAFAFANAKAYVQLGLARGLDVDQFARQLTFRGFGDSSMNFFRGIAAPRAARRIWARIMREEFGAQTDRACLLRGGEHAWGNAYLRMTSARPVNNIVRETVEAMIQACASGQLTGSFPFDEPLGLGHSPEAQQVRRDLERILYYEAKVGSTLDPFAGSYLIESLTDEIEETTLEELARVEEIGGAVAAVETGYYHGQIAQAAWQQQRLLESGEETWVGVNRFTGPDEIDVGVERTPEYPSDRLETAEERARDALSALRAERDETAVSRSLEQLGAAIDDPAVNLMPPLVECALAYATVGEMCDVMRSRWGSADSAGIAGAG